MPQFSSLSTTTDPKDYDLILIVSLFYEIQVMHTGNGCYYYERDKRHDASTLTSNSFITRMSRILREQDISRNLSGKFLHTGNTHDPQNISFERVAEDNTK